MKEIPLGMDGMSLEDLVSVARKGAGVRLSEESKGRIMRARDLVEGWLKEGRIIYGITTGFGALSDRIVSGEDARKLQENILKFIRDPALRKTVGLRAIETIEQGFSEDLMIERLENFFFKNINKTGSSTS